MFCIKIINIAVLSREDARHIIFIIRAVLLLITMKHSLTLLLIISLCSLGNSQNDFYQVDNIQKIEINFKADNWKYLLDSLRFNGEELLTGDIRVNGTSLTEVGVRYRDGRSFTPNGNRNGLYIDLGSKDYQNHHIIDLSSALRDPSLVREVLASEIARTYFNAPSANFAQVTINGVPYGLFVNVEAVEEGYLKNRFGDASGALASPTEEPQTIVAEGCNRNVFGSLQYEKPYTCVEANWEALQGNLGLVQELSSSLIHSPAKVSSLLDVDATLWMLAFNNVLVNLNSYTGQYASNYYLYQLPGGKITPILGELNLAFGSYKNDGINSSDLGTSELLTLSPNLHKGNEQRPLISALLADELNHKQYLAHFRTILVEWVMSGKLENRAKALQAMISEARRNDPGQYYTPVEFNQSLTEVIGKRSRIPGLVDFMDKRAGWLESQEVYTFLPPAISKVGVEGRERFSSTQLDEFRIHATVEDYPKNVYLYYRFNENEAFKMVPMSNDGAHYDGQANDSIFGAVIKPTEGQDRVQYYLMAENVKTVSFSPSHYNFEQYKTTLREVNQ
jgi:hypothetical protein